MDSHLSAGYIRVGQVSVPHPLRVQRRRTKGFRLPEDCISVCRPSKYGNPYRAAEYGIDLCLELYEDSMNGRWDRSRWIKSTPNHLDAPLPGPNYWSVRDLHRAFLARFNGEIPIDVARRELTGKMLACYCPLEKDGRHNPCHVDVILKLLEEQ